MALNFRKIVMKRKSIKKELKAISKLMKEIRAEEALSNAQSIAIIRELIRLRFQKEALNFSENEE
jgi:hypothetical protein